MNNVSNLWSGHKKGSREITDFGLKRVNGFWKRAAKPLNFLGINPYGDSRGVSHKISKTAKI